MSLINLIEFKELGDERGGLISLEQNKNIPFDIKRVYYIFDTKDNVARGFHAHKKLQQVAVCLKGSCRFIMDDGINKDEVTLDRPNIGILIDVMQWHEMYDFSSDCVLLVLASDYYDELDYIRDYDGFLMASEKNDPSVK
ncbi:TPA: sugar 3,4-ketoisomerase [Photobacterium damselae]